MPAVILDRDGVINEDSDAYIKTVGEWRPIAGSIRAIARLSAAGWTIAICTNQSGIARGLTSVKDVDAMHARLRSLVRAEGGEIHGIFVCPHGPDDLCSCRKPLPGLLEQAARELGFSLRGVPVIGDSARDLEAAVRVDARPVLVRTGKGTRTLAQGTNLPPGDIHDNLAAAVDALLREFSENRIDGRHE
ncbi:MAG: D-glycero-beta-D-manno-heptose 1,7-bisphosphate 7-phosphatase [Aquisalimonadaceae bacterium]